MKIFFKYIHINVLHDWEKNKTNQISKQIIGVTKCSYWPLHDCRLFAQISRKFKELQVSISIKTHIFSCFNSQKNYVSSILRYSIIHKNFTHNQQEKTKWRCIQNTKWPESTFFIQLTCCPLPDPYLISWEWSRTLCSGFKSFKTLPQVTYLNPRNRINHN